MSKHSCNFETIHKFSSTFFLSSFLILAIILTSCDLLPQDVSLDQAKIEVSVAQTLIAQEATQAFLDAQEQAEISLQATQTSMAEQFKQTEIALQATQTAQTIEINAVPQAAQAPEAEEEAPVQEGVEQSEEAITSSEVTAGDSAPEFSQEAFEAYMEDAKILLYEDAVNAPWLARYVKDALDDMGLDYKDDGSAIGWLKSDLLSTNWDLVIIALEDPGKPPMGEYFEFINQTLDNGSAVILEIWFLNFVSRGEIASTLSRCGVEFESDYGLSTGSGNDLINWPLPGKSGHPIFNEPNKGLRWTNIAAIRGPDDLGDFIKLSGKKDDAELLLGAIATEKNTHGTLAICNNGKFIIQTFHTHNLAYEESVPLWQNYIYNTLKAKFIETQ